MLNDKSLSKKLKNAKKLNVFPEKIAFLRLSNEVEDKQKNNFLRKNRLFRHALK